MKASLTKLSAAVTFVGATAVGVAGQKAAQPSKIDDRQPAATQQVTSNPVSFWGGVQLRELRSLDLERGADGDRVLLRAQLGMVERRIGELEALKRPSAADNAELKVLRGPPRISRSRPSRVMQPPTDLEYARAIAGHLAFAKAARGTAK